MGFDFFLSVLLSLFLLSPTGEKRIQTFVNDRFASNECLFQKFEILFLKGARELNTMHELINVSVAVKTKWQGSSSQLEMIVIIPST